MDIRLRTAAALFPRVRLGADIGANHGLLACSLLEHGTAERMWLTDISAQALERARTNILRKGLSDRVSFSVGDGFSALPEPVEAAALLGMGGETISTILKSAPDGLLPGALICSAHTDQEIMRRTLYEAGYQLKEERLVSSGGRYYIILLAQRSPETVMPDDRTLFLGPCLIRQRSPEYSLYLKRRLAAYRPSRSQEGIQRYQWLEEESARAAADSQSGT